MASLTDLQTALTEGCNLVLAGSDPFVLDKLDPSRPSNSVFIKNLKSGKGYVTKPSDVQVIGSVDVSLLPWAARSTASDSPDSRINRVRLPFCLKDGTFVEPGAAVTLTNGKTATFVGYSPNRPKFPIDILLNDREMKGPNGCIVSVQGAAPKTLTPERKEALLKGLNNIECGLSPENLTADGELPRAMVERRRRDLHAQRDRAIAELGYTPNANELMEAFNRELAERRIS